MQEQSNTAIRQSGLVDRHVGAQIRLRRTLFGMTQERLASILGISYQQIQKYETGANRVTASRLYEIGRILEADVTYFFEGLAEEPEAPELVQGPRNRAAIDLVRNFLDIANEEQRAALANLIRTLKADPCGSVPAK